MNRADYFPAIDGLRFYAFLFVFFFHFDSYVISHFISTIGWSAVEFFFLISGFLLTKILAKEYKQSKNIQTYKFFMRRILRIWPLYFIFLAGITLVSIFLHYPLSISRLWGNLFFYDNILTTIEGYNYNFSVYHLWSISMEEQYYVILPFLIPWLIKKDHKFIKRFFAITASSLIVIRIILSFFDVNYHVYYMSFFSGDGFLIGIAFGLGTFDEWLKKINPYVALIAGSLLIILLYYMPPRGGHGFQNVFIYTVPALAFGCFFIATVYHDRRLLNSIFCNKVVRYLGKISFGLYIFHIVSFFIARYIFASQNIAMDGRGFIFSLLITILLAILSYEFVEKYFLKLKSRFTIIKSRDV